MQKKITFQLPLISLNKTSILLLMLFSLSACSNSNDDSSESGADNTSEESTKSVPLSTALDNFKTVATDSGLTAE